LSLLPLPIVDVHLYLLLAVAASTASFPRCPCLHLPFPPNMTLAFSADPATAALPTS